MSIRISELPQTNEITDDDLLAVVDTNIDTTMKIDAKTIKDYNNKELIEELDNTNTKLDEEVTRIDEELTAKQPTLTPGENIEINEENVISTPSYVAGDNIRIDGKTISAEYLAYDDSEIKQELADMEYKIDHFQPYDDSEVKADISALQSDKVDKVEGKGLSTNDFTDEYKTKVDNFEPYDDSEIRQDIVDLDNSKVDKVQGKGLSTNDYTNEEKTKLASLENYDDSELKGDITNLENNIIDLQTDKADKSEIPDVSNFITSSVDNLVNYYKKSETYTQSEVNNLIGAIQQFHYEIVQALPQTGANNILYLVPKTTTETQNVYDEYVYANNSWEKIGDTQIDLSDYVTITMLNNALADYTTTTDLTTLLNAKQDNITSSNKLSSDLVDDTNNTNKFVTTNEKSTWSGKYGKPASGIPKTDLDSSVQASLDLADSALQEHQDISGKVDKVQGKGLSTNDLTDELLASLQSGNVEYLEIDNPIWLSDLDTGIYFIQGDSANSVQVYFNGYSQYVSISKIYPMIAMIYKRPAENPGSYRMSTFAYLPYALNVSNISYTNGAKPSNRHLNVLITGTISGTTGSTSNELFAITLASDFVQNIKLGTNVSISNNALTVAPKTTPTNNTDLIGKQYFDTQQALKQDTIQYSTMPTADSSTVGKIVQYIGATDTNYINGYFYKGISTSEEIGGETLTTYSWEDTQVATNNTSSDDLKDIVVFPENVFAVGNNYKQTITGSNVKALTKMIRYIQQHLKANSNALDKPLYIFFTQITAGSPITFAFLNTWLTVYANINYVKNTFLNVTIGIPQNITSASQSGIGIVSANTVITFEVQASDNELEDITKDITKCIIKFQNGTTNNFSYINTAQTISSKKTFTTLPESSVTPTTDNQLVNKSYVDTTISNAIGTALGGNY